jgi:hypothetical protein
MASMLLWAARMHQNGAYHGRKVQHRFQTRVVWEASDDVAIMFSRCFHGAAVPATVRRRPSSSSHAEATVCTLMHEYVAAESFPLPELQALEVGTHVAGGEKSRRNRR